MQCESCKYTALEVSFQVIPRKNGFFLAVQQKIRKDFVRLALLIS
ncbi:hypothetical protein ALP44_102748 [Pseudomonas syringae pv. theae]|uniref:Uncharacterized protein n=1 Tax=Pseudomonas syringae pv. theae TaxID=103985 RepID=A0A3M5MBG7_PSESX|nr:hypothetical protein ALP44_102748 [Pseudomonas syringae pv. theae]